jgi:hypothetical protein
MDDTAAGRVQKFRMDRVVRRWVNGEPLPGWQVSPAGDAGLYFVEPGLMRGDTFYAFVPWTSIEAHIPEYLRAAFGDE